MASTSASLHYFNASILAPQIFHPPVNNDDLFGKKNKILRIKM